MKRLTSLLSWQVMRSPAASCLVLLLALLGAARPASAQTEPIGGASSVSDAQRAAALFRRAKDAVDADNLHDALRDFSEAWALSKTSEVAANLAIVEASFGHHRDAAEHFRFALSHLSPSTTDEQKQAIVTGLDAAKRYVLTLVIQGAPAGASISIDGTVIGQAPLIDDVYVEPRAHAVRADAVGFESMSRQIQGAAGMALIVRLELKPVVTATRAIALTAEPKTAQRAKKSPIPLFVGGGIAVAGAALGTIFWVKAERSNKDALGKTDALPPVANACGANTPYIVECKGIHDAYVAEDRNRNLSIASFAIGGAAAAGALLYWFWPRNHVATRPTASAMLAPGYATVHASWDW